MNFCLLYFCNFSLQVIEQSFSYLKACFVMIHLAYFDNFYENVPGKLFGDSAAKSYDYLYYLLLDFEVALLFFKFKNLL